MSENRLIALLLLFSFGFVATPVVSELLEDPTRPLDYFDVDNNVNLELDKEILDDEVALDDFDMQMVFDGVNSFILIDNQNYREGDTVGRFVIMSIDDSKVYFRSTMTNSIYYKYLIDEVKKDIGDR